MTEETKQRLAEIKRKNFCERYAYSDAQSTSDVQFIIRLLTESEARCERYRSALEKIAKDVYADCRSLNTVREALQK